MLLVCCGAGVVVGVAEQKSDCAASEERKEDGGMWRVGQYFRYKERASGLRKFLGERKRALRGC